MVPRAPDPVDPGVEVDLAPPGAEAPAHGLRHLAVVHDPGAGHVQGRHAADLGLQFPGLPLVHPPQGDAVGEAPAGQFLQAGQLGLGGGHHQLAAQVVGQPLLPAEGHHGRVALQAEPGLQAAGPVVEPGVEDPAVVARLVPRQPPLLLDQGPPGSRKAFLEGQGRGQAHDPSSDHQAVVAA